MVSRPTRPGRRTSHYRLAATLRPAVVRHAARRVDCDGIRMTLYYYGMECDIHTYNGTLPPRSWSVEYLKTRSPSSSPIPPPWLLAPTPTRTLLQVWPLAYTEVDKCSGLSPVHPWCMGERNADATYRAFNYPHHAASYWAIPRHLALRSPQTRQPLAVVRLVVFQTIPSTIISSTSLTLTSISTLTLRYLERAAKTSLRFSCGTGVMDGTVFREILHALKAEGELHSLNSSASLDAEPTHPNPTLSQAHSTQPWPRGRLSLRPNACEAAPLGGGSLPMQAASLPLTPQVRRRSSCGTHFGNTTAAKVRTCISSGPVYSPHPSSSSSAPSPHPQATVDHILSPCAPPLLGGTTEAPGRG